MRTSTILLALLTSVAAVSTITLAVVIGPDDDFLFFEVLRDGSIATSASGAAWYSLVTRRQREERLQLAAEAFRGMAVVDAEATASTVAELAVWRPDMALRFPCSLGFDRSGIRAWQYSDPKKTVALAGRDEVVRFDVFVEPTSNGVLDRYGVVIHLRRGSADTTLLHVRMLDEQKHHDEYALRKTIRRIEAALGPRRDA